MKSEFLSGKVMLHQGDARDVLRSLPDDHFHACVTDPPYALVSIVKRFSNTNESDDTKTSQRARDRADSYARFTAGGFMGQTWDTGDVAHNVTFWREVFRVLRPGAHLVVFGGTRTYHRMVCAIEDAGFEIRDTLMWLYGSGFPKSHDVSKGIDATSLYGRADSVGLRMRDGRTPGIVGTNMHKHRSGKNDVEQDTEAAAALQTDAARQWQGYGTALKPACEPIVLARKPLSESTVVANVLRWGCGAINVDGCRVEYTAGGRPSDSCWSKNAKSGDKSGSQVYGDYQTTNRTIAEKEHPFGRWPANVIHDGSEEVLAGFPETSTTGARIDPTKSYNRVSDGIGPANNHDGAEYTDSGSAARFFYTVKQDEPCSQNVSDVGICSLGCHRRNDDFVQPIALDSQLLRIVQNVKSAANLCDSCAIAIARSLAAMQRGQSPEETLSQASISERNKRILLRNLVQYVAGRESTDIITTTASLRILLGSVLHAIAESINSERNEELENIDFVQKRFHYSSKADSDERIGSKHPTVKPLDLMQWLVRLVTPKGGLVLDPFAGTGTTGEAAWREGMRAVLIEREPDYCIDIERRMRLALAGPVERTGEIVKAKGGDVDLGPLFGGVS